MVCDDRLVEVKCPFKKEIRESCSIATSGYVPLGVDASGVPVLKESHPYFIRYSYSCSVPR